MNFKSLSIILLTFAISIFFACNQNKTIAEKEVQLNTEVDTVSYSLGISIGENLKSQGIKEINYDAFAKALSDALSEDTTVENQITVESAQVIIQNYFQKVYTAKMEENKKAGENFLAENKGKEGVKTLESGIQYKVIKEGKGEVPAAEDKVTVHYTGYKLDGTVFDSSVERGQPATFPVNQVIPGWTEILQLMPVGSKWKVFIPAELAYGERPPRGANIEPNSTLIFDIELLSIAVADSTENDQPQQPQQPQQIK